MLSISKQVTKRSIGDPLGVYLENIARDGIDKATIAAPLTEKDIVSEANQYSVIVDMMPAAMRRHASPRDESILTLRLQR